MSELRRNGGPDDGDKPADAVANTDAPTRRPSLEIRSADQHPDRPVDRRKVTTTQRHFMSMEKEAADSPAEGTPVSTRSVDWKTGESADGRHAPPSRDKGRKKPDDSPYADPPPDLHRNNADLEARSIQRVEDESGFNGFDDVKPGRRKSRGSWDKIVEKSDSVVGGVKSVSDKLDHVFNPPQPTGEFVGCTPQPPPHIANQYAGHNVSDIAAAATAVVIMGIDLSRKIYGKFDEWKDKNAGNG